MWAISLASEALTAFFGILHELRSIPYFLNGTKTAVFKCESRQRSSSLPPTPPTPTMHPNTTYRMENNWLADRLYSNIRPSSNVIWFLSVLLTTGILISFFDNKKRNPHGYPLPPGPQALPLIGNVLDIPKEFEYLTYNNWRQVHGKS